MTIGIDAGNNLDRPPTGVAVYARNVLFGLARARPDERFLWYYRSNRYLRSFGAGLPANAERRLLERFALRWSSRKLRLFHGLNQRLPLECRCPTVATFHDLFALSGEYSTPTFRSRFASLARETAERANHVIAVSAYTAEQVVGRLGFPRSNITVVHHGAEALKVPAQDRRGHILRRLGVTRPFVLHVGTLQVRKNVDRVIAAFEMAGGSTELVLAGSHGYGAERILDRIRCSPARARILLPGHVAEEVRATLYACAEVLLFPSLEEGFGLPIVEAFSVGLPVVTSNVSALPEVAGGAAALIDPLDTDAIAAALGEVLESSSLRSELRRKGTLRARQFQWQRCAEETWKVYEQLAADRR